MEAALPSKCYELKQSSDESMAEFNAWNNETYLNFFRKISEQHSTSMESLLDIWASDY